MSKLPENPTPGDMIHMIVEDHRINGGYVCPYAKLAATIKTLPDQANPQNASEFHDAVSNGLEEFHKAKSASLIYIIPESPKNHEEGRAQTEDVFNHLRMAALKIKPGVLIDPRKRNRAFSILPFGDDKLLAIGLNHLYPEQHPRYSPHPIVAITKVSDILKLSEEQTFSVRQKAIRRLIQAHIPHLSIEEIEGSTTIQMVLKGRNPVLDVEVDDAIATPDILKAIESYGLNVPLYLMPEETT